MEHVCQDVEINTVDRHGGSLHRLQYSKHYTSRTTSPQSGHWASATGWSPTAVSLHPNPGLCLNSVLSCTLDDMAETSLGLSRSGNNWICTNLNSRTSSYETNVAECFNRFPRVTRRQPRTLSLSSPPEYKDALTRPVAQHESMGLRFKSGKADLRCSYCLFRRVLTTTTITPSAAAARRMFLPPWHC